MEVFSVGPDELSSYEIDEVKNENAKYLVYSYENFGYEGSGDAIVINNDNSLIHHELSHCSCYGPFDGGGTSVSIEDVLAPKESVHEFDCAEEIKSKVKELLGL